MAKIISRLRKNNAIKTSNIIKTSRLRRIIVSEWQQINPTDPNTIQELTDAMTYGYAVQINYKGSGWRTIQPYGWNTSKDGNILLMCYKDSGEVRSYRMDRIEDIYIDQDSTFSITNNPEMNSDNDIENLLNMQNEDQFVYETYDDDDDYPDDMPLIPETYSTNYNEQGIYDDELQMLQDNVIEQPVNEEFVGETPEVEPIAEDNQYNDIELNNTEEQSDDQNQI